MGCKRGTDYRKRGKALRPVQEPFLPAYFENVGEAELGWRNRFHSHVMYGNWGTFIFFLLAIVLLVTLLFWVPFLLLYSLDALDCENVDSILDTLALAFSTLLNVQSQYAPKSGLVVIAISIESMFGRLILAGVTAILVVKASKVRNNLVISEKVLVHKKNDGFWYISCRVGSMYKQNIFGTYIRMTCVSPRGSINKSMYNKGNLAINLPIYDALNDGAFQLGGIPRNVRHRIDEKSPLFGAVQDFESYEGTKKLLTSIFVHVSGVDELTGRGVGKTRCFLFSNSTIFYSKHAKFNDVIVSKTALPLAIRRGSIFKSIGGKKRVNVKVKTSRKETTLAIYWSNFNGIHEGPSQADEEGNVGNARPALTNSKASDTLDV